MTVNRGVVGGFADTLTPAVCADIDRLFETWLGNVPAMQQLREHMAMGAVDGAASQRHEADATAGVGQ